MANDVPIQVIVAAFQCEDAADTAPKELQQAQRDELIHGGLGAPLRDADFPDDRQRRIGDGLTPGSSAIVAVVEHSWVDTVRRWLQQDGVEVGTEVSPRAADESG